MWSNASREMFITEGEKSKSINWYLRFNVVSMSFVMDVHFLLFYCLHKNSINLRNSSRWIYIYVHIQTHLQLEWFCNAELFMLLVSVLSLPQP